MSIIAVSGKMGSGKDTVGQIIQTLAGESWEVKRFSHKIKVMATLITGIPIEKFEDQEFKRTDLGDEWNLTTHHWAYPVTYPMTVRDMLQKIGTEAMRNNLHQDVWVNALMIDYVRGSQLETLPNWVITDCRFLNEAAAIKRKKGIIVRVERPNIMTNDMHQSEIELDRYDFDYVIQNDGTLEELTEKVRVILADRQFI